MMYFTRNQIAALATLKHATAQTTKERDAAPILGCVRIIPSSGIVVAHATDRMIAAMLSFKPQSTELVAPFTIGADTLVDWAKQKHGATVNLTIDPNDNVVNITATFDNGNTINATPPSTQSYPPIERLFPSGDCREIEAGQIFDLTKLARIGKLRTPDTLGDSFASAFTIAATPTQGTVTTMQLKPRAVHTDSDLTVLLMGVKKI